MGLKRWRVQKSARTLAIPERQESEVADSEASAQRLHEETLASLAMVETDMLASVRTIDAAAASARDAAKQSKSLSTRSGRVPPRRRRSRDRWRRNRRDRASLRRIRDKRLGTDAHGHVRYPWRKPRPEHCRLDGAFLRGTRPRGERDRRHPRHDHAFRAPDEPAVAECHDRGGEGRLRWTRLRRGRQRSEDPGLASEASASDIRLKIQQLRDLVASSTANADRLAEEIEALQPLFTSAARAVSLQDESASELAKRVTLAAASPERSATRSRASITRRCTPSRNAPGAMPERQKSRTRSPTSGADS